MRWKKTTKTKGNNKKYEQQRTYKYLGHCSVDLKWKAKDTARGYRPDILSYNAKIIQLTKFSAEHSLADTEEGNENEKRFLSSFNSSEVQASTSQRSPLGNFSAVVVNAAY